MSFKYLLDCYKQYVNYITENLKKQERPTNTRLEIIIKILNL